LSPLLALTIYISFIISKSKFKIQKYYGYINTGFWLLGLICFWYYAVRFVPPLLSEGDKDGSTISMSAMIPISGSFIFNAVASFISYKSFLKRFSPKSIITLNNTDPGQGLLSEDEVITKS